MTNSEFWGRCAKKFRESDPSGAHLRASWSADLDTDGHAGTPSWTLMAVEEIGLTVKVEFELMARRAGEKLRKLDDDPLGVWLNAVKDHHGGDLSESDFRQGPDGTNIERVGGTIHALCLVSSELCKEHEARTIEGERTLLIRMLNTLGPAIQGDLRVQFDSRLNALQDRLDDLAIEKKLREIKMPKRDPGKAAERKAFMDPYLAKETLSAIATGSRVIHSSLYRWHKGISCLRPDNKNKLANYLQVDLGRIPN